MAGGEKTVTYPKDQFAALTKWPRYGDAEKQALCALLDNNKFYEELPAFEKEWQDYTQSPFVKNHINGTSALTSMYFALDLPAGQRNHGALLHVLRHLPGDALLRLRAHLH